MKAFILQHASNIYPSQRILQRERNGSRARQLLENEYQSSLTKIIWDSRKAIKGLSVEEIKENILCSVYDNNSKLN